MPQKPEEMAGFPPLPPGELADAVRVGVVVEPLLQRTLVYAVVTDTADPAANRETWLPCRDGTPLGGYAVDFERDAVLADAVDYAMLGTVGMAFDATVPTAGPWRVAVPMPDRVVEALLDSRQRRKLAATRERRPAPRYRIDFVQFRGSS